MLLDGKVLELYIAIKDKGRVSKNSIEVDCGGIVDDKFYGKNIDRSILITSISSYELAKEHNINTDYGLLGENILIDINPYALKSGDRLQIGEVILEISQHCTICNSLSKIDKSLPKILENDRGIFTKVIKNGKIRQNDTVQIIKI